MSFVQGSALEKVYEGSHEDRLAGIHSAIEEHFGDSPVNIVATHDKHAIVFNEDGCLLKVTLDTDKKGNPKVVSAKPSKIVPVIEDEDVPAHVSKELRSIVTNMLEGKEVTRTQVREVASLLKKDEDYWLSDILSKLDEAMGETDWYKMYEANTERIRTSLYGSLKALEGQVPNTKYSKMSAKKIGKFTEELEESLVMLGGVAQSIVDECSKLVFDKDDDFLAVIRESLIVEAQAVIDLLGKAGKLMNPSDLVRIAEAHDKMADRARVMTVVSGYLGTKAQATSNEE